MYGGTNGREGYYYPVILMLREQETAEKDVKEETSQKINDMLSL